MGEQTAERKRRGMVSKLVRLSAVAGLGVLLIKKKRSRSAPAEGLWRDGFAPGGTSSGQRH
ncbi:MAG: hypothetical protein NVSMB32_18730 [Actinomycetota bacterium]